MERQINILIVDDDTGLTSNLQDILEAEGYSTAVANDGQTALALYDKSVFDLALVDFRLPDMSGIDLIKESVGLSPRVEYVIITGFASLDSAIDAVIHRNIVGYLTKPLNMEYLTLLIRQVIERRQAEVALKQSEEKYYSLLDNANDIVQYVGPDARFQFVNKQWLETLGYSAEEVENLKVTDILPENQIARIMKTLQGLADGGTVENIETTFISKYGKEIDVEGSGKGILQDGEFVGAIGIFRDITERKQADEAIKRSKDYLENLNNSLSEAIVTVNIPNKIQDRVFQYANRSVEAIFGYQPEELIGQSPEIQYPSHEEFLSMGRELKHGIKQGESVTRRERLMKRKNGETFPAEVTTTFIRTGGEVTQVLSIIRDITELKQAEEQIKHLTLTLRSIRNVNQLITREKDREKLLQEACRLLTGAGSYANAWIALLDESGKLLAHAESGWGRGFLPLLEQLKLGEIPACGRQALEQASVVVTDEMASTCTGCPLPDRLNGKVALTVRLEHAGKVYGLLSVSMPGAFVTDEESGLFKEVADDIAFALHTMVLEAKHKEVEGAILESEEKYRDLYSNAPTAYFSVGPDSFIKESNKAARQLFGYSEDEFLKIPILDLYAEESKSKAKSAFKTRFKQGLDIVNEEMAYLRKDGKKVYGLLSASLIKDKDGHVVASRSVVRDITERKQAEEELTDEATRRRILVEQSRDGIVILTRNGDVYEANHRFCEMLGYSLEETLQLKVWDWEFQLPHEQVQDMIRNVDETGDSFETQHRRKDGTVFDVDISTNAAVFAGQKLIFCVCRDITERRKMQEQLMAQDRLASIGQLVSGVAHEINNPLTGVLGFSELLLEREDLPDDVKKDLKVVNNEARRTATIVKNLLTFARKQPEGKEPVQVNEQIQKVLDLRGHEQKVNNIQVVTRFAPGLPQVMGNASQLQQVFFNIVINAEFFILEAHQKGNITITTERIGDFVRASLTDDGPGISEENVKNLFTPFFTTKEVGKGTGLGLSICHGIITEHGGKIYAESEIGKGATFIMELPTKEATTSQEAAE